MKKILLILSFIYLSVCPAQVANNNHTYPNILYKVDVTDYSDDLFHIIVYTEGLTSENDIYNLPATVPGTYSNLNFGRFVNNFKAYDEEGNELTVKKISVNQWQIADANKLAKIVYDSDDTFDAGVKPMLFPMSGTGIEDDLIVINTFGIFGYFEGLQSVPVKVKIDYNPDWIIGTSLTQDDEGYYTAESYDYLADSPVLMGDLTTAFTTVNDIKVGVYVYSPDTTINAKSILKIADDLLQSSSEFIGYSPVTHYNFLMCLLNQETYMRNGFIGGGALEHSYSSLFVFPSFGNFSNDIQDHMAHEFMHILTPLNLHSNIIQPFNFVVPTASQHTWLYEGVTEWNSDIMQMRGGLISADEYLQRVSEKLSTNDNFRQDLSLTELSLGVYSEQIYGEFLNFYNKGAVTAALLDIRLLELSGGIRGLREVFLELLNKYGKDKPFPEDELFRIIVDMTYPEIEDFINFYIKGTKPLPYAEYMAKLGYNYISERPSEDTRPTLGLGFSVNDNNELIVFEMNEQAHLAGLKKEDVILKLLGEEVNMATAGKLFGQITSMNVGDECALLVKRGDNEIEINVPLQQRVDKHIFEDMEGLTKEQKFLRDVWMRNL